MPTILFALLATQSVPYLPPPLPLPPALQSEKRLAPRLPADSHVLFVNFDGAILHGDPTCSNAVLNCSFIVQSASVSYPAFAGTATQRQQILNLVRQYYDPFNVQIVTTRPATGPYSMTMVGGTPDNIGFGSSGAAGVAPLDCNDMLPTDVSFAFSAVVGNSPHAVATVIAQESAHGFGLGHTDDMRDVMYPVVNDFGTGFLDKVMHIFDLGSGSSSCDGSGIQNSAALMRANVGASPPDTMPPTISFLSPHDGDTVPSGFSIEFDARDDRVLVSVDVYANGSPLITIGRWPWRFTVAGGTMPPGPLTLRGVAKDHGGNQAETGEIAIVVKKVGESPGDIGTPCATTGDCNGDGICIPIGGRQQCTRTCDLVAGCPNGFECLTTPDFQQICAPAAKEEGCVAVPGRSDDGGSGLSLALLALLAICVSAASRGARCAS